ncbi:ABC-type dipeptide/oligopeptide/nickel transport system permease subunit [Evansella vedderi]|uniref:ABC-type dipeptide/oligopeptide/nickel transport system permease subunit n=1 Tax=Evansella vedderi TaxID=38282 RepID=A0ABU0A0V7_9BACI|nr:ABC transporter permease [Evansella vedderi]MDQ0257117.1 ABC-type dipeptide/oligopeptide/nickel transport system permease subunit [Evansella vedderi]
MEATQKVEINVPRRKSEFQKFIKVLLARKVVVISLSILFLLVVVAIFAPWIAPYNPYTQNIANSLQPPSKEHILGTDQLGRDVLSRIIYGSRASLIVGFSSVALAGVIGSTLGLVAGYFGGILDSIIMRFMDALLAIPPIVLALSLGAALGGGLVGVVVALGVALIPTYARLMRGQVMAVREMDYIKAGEISGISNLRNILVHVMPNCISPIIVLATLNLGIAILAEAGLSFLGLGVNPPQAAWGSMVNDGYQYLSRLPGLSFAPGLCIVLVVMAFNIVGDALRDALDPKLRGSL